MAIGATAAALALLIGGCAPLPAPPPSAQARFIAPDRIEVEASAGLRLLDAWALDERERRFPALEIEEAAGDRPPWRPGLGVAAYGGPHSGVDAGFSIGLPLTNPFRRPAPQYSSRTVFVLADPARYRQHWQGWRIHLQFGERTADGREGDIRALVLNAPPPG